VSELAREDRPIDIYAPTGVLERRLKHGTYRMPPIPELVVTPREAFLSEYVEVPFKKSAGRVCVEVVTPYPPGIPILCPGERITQETIEYLRLELKAGVHIQGPVDERLGTIRVLP
jgi:arginine/lysine/ornithine decarboxylase